jgi:hypothetical protein
MSQQLQDHTDPNGVITQADHTMDAAPGKKKNGVKEK